MDLTPRSPIVLLESSSLQSEVLTRKASAMAMAPFSADLVVREVEQCERFVNLEGLAYGPIHLYERSSAVSEVLTLRAFAITRAPFAPTALYARLKAV